MYRLIDLDQAGKDADGYVFLITLGGEKVGLSDQELGEMIRAKYGTKGLPKKGGGKGLRGASIADTEALPEAVSEEEVPLA